MVTLSTLMQPLRSHSAVRRYWPPDVAMAVGPSMAPSKEPVSVDQTTEVSSKEGTLPMSSMPGVKHVMVPGSPALMSSFVVSMAT